MLKIKDDVDLKVLEKYGFNYCNNIEWYSYEIESASLGLECNSREIYFYCDNGVDYQKPLGVLYDLIQDGLVEKVE